MNRSQVEILNFGKFKNIELKEFLTCFPYLKSNEKLRQQDAIWKNICKELKWEFIKSL